MTTNSPSPSPPPAAPIPLQPGPRAVRLQNVHNQALAATLHSISLSSFTACFPTLAVTMPRALQGMHADLIRKLEGFATDEFDRLLQERKVVEGLNGLEVIIEEGKKRKQNGEGPVVAPHALPPQALMRAHLSPIHIQQQSQLNAKMQTTASVNARLAGEITQQKDEIERLLSLVETIVRDLEGAVTGMEGVEEGKGVEEVSARAREAALVLAANGT